MRKCLDEGLLQSYVDGELSPELTEEASAHLASCAACAEALREAEAELSLFANAFDHGATLGVPTERLRARIETAIAELESSAPQSRSNVHVAARPSLREKLATLFGSLSLNPARSAAFASVAALVAFGILFALVISRRAETNKTEFANNGAQQSIPPASQNGSTTEESVGQTNEVATLSEGGNTNTSVREAANVEPVSFKRRAIARKSVRAVRNKSENIPTRVPGEDQYLNTIASLSKVVEAGGDSLLSPTVRADYERDLAVVNQAIEATRRNALRNPKDAGAKEFLLSAYQSKIELLGTVANQAQLVAVNR